MTTRHPITADAADLAERMAADLFPDDGYDAMGAAETRASAAADIAQELASTTVNTITFADARPGNEIYWNGALRIVVAVKRSTLPAHAEYRGIRHNRPQSMTTLMFRTGRRESATELGSVAISRITR